MKKQSNIICFPSFFTWWCPMKDGHQETLLPSLLSWQCLWTLLFRRSSTLLFFPSWKTTEVSDVTQLGNFLHLCSNFRNEPPLFYKNPSQMCQESVGSSFTFTYFHSHFRLFFTSKRNECNGGKKASGLKFNSQEPPRRYRLISDVNKGNEEGREIELFLLLPFCSLWVLLSCLCVSYVSGEEREERNMEWRRKCNSSVFLFILFD